MLRVEPSLDFVLLTRKSLNSEIKKTLAVSLPLHEIDYSHIHPNTMFSLGSIVDGLGADLYHSPFMLQPLFMKTPGIITIHDAMWMTKPWLIGGGLRLRTALGWCYFRNMAYLSSKASERIVAVSETTRQDIVGNWGDLNGKVMTILPGLNPKFSPTGDQDSLKHRLTVLGLAGQGFFLHVTNAKPYKNTLGVLRAFTKMSNQSNLFLVLVGRTSDLTKHMIREIRKLNITDRVKVLGSISDDDLIALMRSATALVFPSFYEGFGLPVLEAMGTGCPVITSKNGALHEAAGDAALFVDPSSIDSIADGMVKLATNALIREALRKKGLERSSLFAWDASVSNIMRVYQDILR